MRLRVGQKARPDPVVAMCRKMKSRICGLALLILYVCPTFGEAIFVESAALRSHASSVNTTTQGREHYVAMLLGGHQISAGNAVVIRLNTITPDSRTKSADGKYEYVIADSATFHTLSVEVPEMPKVGSQIKLYSASDLRLYFSAGSVAWLESGGGAYSKTATGTISVSRVTEELATVAFDLTFHPVQADVSRGVQKMERISTTKDFDRIPISKVSNNLLAPYKQ